MLRHEFAQFVIEGCLDTGLGLRGFVADHLRCLGETCPFQPGRAPGGVPHDQCAFQQFQRDVLLRLDPLLQLASPRLEDVGPRLDGECPTTDSIQLDLAVPTIGVVVVLEG